MPAGTLATPVLLKPQTPRNLRPTQDIIDSSPDSPDDLTRTLPAVHSPELPEPIELPSSLVPESPCQLSPVLGAEHPHKRRRISITSSEPDSVSTRDLKEETDDIDLVPASSFLDDDSDKVTNGKTLDENDEICEIKDGEGQQDPPCYSSDEEALEEYHFPGHRRGGELVPGEHHRPIFFNPPSFKPLGPTDSAPEANVLPPDRLADIFSPSKRKGAKYLTGGLAAELRDWLVDVKTESEKRIAPNALAKLAVGSVRGGGRGITLVSGKPTPTTTVDAGSEAPEFRTILVGEGGLGSDDHGGLQSSRNGRPRGIVSSGKIVGIAPPAWDVDLPGQGKWSVAYRWEMMDDTTNPRLEE